MPPPTDDTPLLPSITRSTCDALRVALERHGFSVSERPGREITVDAWGHGKVMEIQPRSVSVTSPLWPTSRFELRRGLWGCASIVRDGQEPELLLIPSQRWEMLDDVFVLQSNVRVPAEWSIRRILGKQLPVELEEFRIDRVLAEQVSTRTTSGQRCSDAIQHELRRRAVSEVAAVEAAGWLDELGVLRDNPTRSGLPLRNLLRAGAIQGAEQRPPAERGHWFIKLVRGDNGAAAAAESPSMPTRPEYSSVDETASSVYCDPFSRDPEAVDRGNQSHARLQNLLAAWLRTRHERPVYPSLDDPNCDLLWVGADGITWVAEVKSLTMDNERHQLRLGLGQLLEYRHRLSAERNVRAVLMVEREPRAPHWQTLCDELGIELLWPERLSDR